MITEETKTPKVDDRYVAICSKIRVKGQELREEIFKALETDNYELAFEKMDEVVKYDRCFMLSLKMGMELVENEKKENVASAAASAALKKIEEAQKAAPSTAPQPRRGFFGKIFGG